MNEYAQLYDQLSGRRNALVKWYGPRSGLKQYNPSAYQQYQEKIRDLNRQLRLLRLRLVSAVKPQPTEVGL
ncbi:hypothetical protein [Spirosoma knui]